MPVADTPVADTPVADTPVADTPVADTLVAHDPEAYPPSRRGSDAHRPQGRAGAGRRDPVRGRAAKADRPVAPRRNNPELLPLYGNGNLQAIREPLAAPRADRAGAVAGAVRREHQADARVRLRRHRDLPSDVRTADQAPRLGHRAAGHRERIIAQRQEAQADLLTEEEPETEPGCRRLRGRPMRVTLPLARGFDRGQVEDPERSGAGD